MGKLRKAIKDWIKADYAFRMGPVAYTAMSQEFLIHAESGLRKAVTGTDQITEAAQRVGLPTTDWAQEAVNDFKSRNRSGRKIPRKKLHRRETESPGTQIKKAPKGLFDK